MKRISLIIILLIILPVYVFPSNVLDSLKQARAENFNNSFIEKTYRELLSKNTNKINGISYIEINVDSTQHISASYIIDSLTTINDKAFLNSLLKELNGKKMYVYNKGEKLTSKKNIYRSQIDWGTLTSVVLYKGRNQNNLRSALMSLNREISNIYTMSLKEIDYEGIINLNISVDEKGNVVKHSLNDVTDLASASNLILKLDSFFKNVRFDSLDGGSEILNTNMYFRFKKVWFPEYSTDTITIPISLTEKREDSIVSFIKNEYSKSFGRIPVRESNVYMLSVTEGIGLTDYDNAIKLHFTNKFKSRYSFNKINNPDIDKGLIDWYKNNKSNSSENECLKKIKNFDYLLIISFQCIAYPANISSFSGMNFGFDFISNVVSGLGNSNGGNFTISSSDLKFEYGFGTAVIAGIKLIFCDVKTGKVICEKGDYNDSSFEGAESTLSKEILFNVEEILEDITFY